MGEPWSSEQVLALAPDASSASAGRGLSSPAPWSDTGRCGDLLWGLCKGSGKQPYQAIVDLSGPAFRCSCPSRKFPCKHSLGLLLLWSAGGVQTRDVPADYAEAWSAQRVERAEKVAEKAAAPKPPPDPVQAAKRAAKRTDRVTAGLDELDRWLRDQIRTGLGSLDRGYAHFDAVAARMVDAQAPTVAAILRRLPSVASTSEGWTARLLEEYAMLRLLATAHSRLDQLSDDDAANIRAHVGFTVAKEDVLASEPIRDRWFVMAMRDSLDDRIASRRVWLRGEATTRSALVLSFGPSSRDLDASLLPGTVVDANLHFYPGAPPLRATVGERHSSPVVSPPPVGTTIAVLLAEWASALAGDPWLGSWPAMLQATPVYANDSWLLTDETASIPVIQTAADLWRLAAVAGGRAVPVSGEWTSRGFLPIATWGEFGLVTL